MLDLFLTAAGIVAFRAYRITGWMLSHPFSLLVVLGLFLALATGAWYFVPLMLAGALLAYGRRELHGSAYRRGRGRGVIETAPPPADVRAAPVAAAVLLMAFALIISLPTEGVTTGFRVLMFVLAATILVGWKIGYVCFRPLGQVPNELSAQLEPGQWCPASASGRLLTKDCVFEAVVDGHQTLHTVLIDSGDPAQYGPELRLLEPVRVLNAPAGGVRYKGRTFESRVVLVTPSGRAGLSLARPDVRSLEAGTLKQVRGERPALRLETVVGPLVLSFESPEARVSAMRAISAALS